MMKDTFMPAEGSIDCLLAAPARWLLDPAERLRMLRQNPIRLLGFASRGRENGDSVTTANK